MRSVHEKGVEVVAPLRLQHLHDALELAVEVLSCVGMCARVGIDVVVIVVNSQVLDNSLETRIT